MCVCACKLPTQRPVLGEQSLYNVVTFLIVIICTLALNTAPQFPVLIFKQNYPQAHPALFAQWLVSPFLLYLIAVVD